MAKILVVTSCTGRKQAVDDHPLTQSDFRAGAAHVAQREASLAPHMQRAEDMYAGQQHVRLMRGIRAVRSISESDVELWIISAGYGFIDGERKIAPYEATFSGLPKDQLREYASELGIPRDFRAIAARPFDLIILLLGNDYFASIEGDEPLQVASPTLVLCSQSVADQIAGWPLLHPLVLSRSEARAFGCGLVGLKGEVASRILHRIAHDPSTIAEFQQPEPSLLRTLTQESVAEYPQPIHIHEDWVQQSARRKLHFYIPDWDDLVDPNYDFQSDTHSAGFGDWTNEVFAHEIYGAPNYDGILVSRVVIEKNSKKRQRIDQVGIHRYLRVPDSFRVMGDCGAFGYIDEDEPPYSTEDVIDYYTRHGFNLGVSVDHLIVAATDAQRRERYELTIANARDFLKEHQNQALHWEPIGAVQGWDPSSYAEAARQVAEMGYDYIALGGLVRSTTAEILNVVQHVREVIPNDIRLHLFGLARLPAIPALVDLGVQSVDSASVLRRAWLDSRHNYLTEDGWFSAIRIPDSQHSPRARKTIGEGKVSASELKSLESACLGGLRLYGTRANGLSRELVDSLTEYEALLGNSGANRREQIHRTLEHRPWESCSCRICQEIGVEVILFRGNNRNRRRGFHNTYVFYRLLARLSEGEQIPWIEPMGPRQLSLV